MGRATVTIYELWGRERRVLAKGNGRWRCCLGFARHTWLRLCGRTLTDKELPRIEWPLARSHPEKEVFRQVSLVSPCFDEKRATHRVVGDVVFSSGRVGVGCATWKVYRKHIDSIA